MKKHISTLIYMSITFIMLFKVQQSEGSVQEKLVMRRTNIQSLFYELQMQWDTYLKRFLELTQAAAEISCDMF